MPGFGNQSKKNNDSGLSDTYQANRNKQQEENKENAANKKAYKVLAKGTADYLTGGQGGKAVDAFFNTKLGNSVANHGAKYLDSIPGMSKATKKLDDAGALDVADKALSMGAINGGKGAETSANPSSLESVSGSKGGENQVGQSSSFASMVPNSLGGFDRKESTNLLSDSKGESNSEESQVLEGTGKAFFKKHKFMIIGAVAGFFIILFFGMLLISIVTNMFSPIESAMAWLEKTKNSAVYYSSYIFRGFGGTSLYAEYVDIKNSLFSDEDEETLFDENIVRIAEIYSSGDKGNFPVEILPAVYYVVNDYNPEYTFKDFDYVVLEQIAKCMDASRIEDGDNDSSNDEYTYSFDKEKFAEKLATYLGSEFMEDLSEEEVKEKVNDVYSYLDDYADLINAGSAEDDNASTCGVAGNCTYDIKGFSNGTKTFVKAMNVSNLKVRLMECKSAVPVSGEELIDFEKYILGVTYQENGGSTNEAIKAQAVAARSYALSRPTMMNNSAGTKLAKENGQWILQLRACTYDQAYCDPDKGCWSTTTGGEYGGTIHSGSSSTAAWSRSSLPQNSKLRKLVAETSGQVVVNSKGYILNTSYLSTDQNNWATLSRNGLNYKQILLQYYNNNKKMGATDILQVTCSGKNTNCSSQGDYASWLQSGQSWSSINLGNSSHTISSAGCLVTSISMLIAKSGVQTTVDGEFNPGTFVQKLNANGGFVGANLQWAKVSVAAPNFVYQGSVQISGLSKEEKLNKINNLLSSGYYVVAEVKGSTGQHWVAIDSVSGNTVNMMDPGSTSTDMWKQYNWKNTSRLSYFKVA